LRPPGRSLPGRAGHWFDSGARFRLLSGGTEAIGVLLGQQAFREIEPFMRLPKLAAQGSHLVLQRGKPGRSLRVLNPCPSFCPYPRHLDAGEREDRDDGNQRAEYARVHRPYRGVGGGSGNKVLRLSCRGQELRAEFGRGWDGVSRPRITCRARRGRRACRPAGGHANPAQTEGASWLVHALVRRQLTRRVVKRACAERGQRRERRTRWRTRRLAEPAVHRLARRTLGRARRAGESEVG
jgi:hypothetical protein